MTAGIRKDNISAFQIFPMAIFLFSFIHKMNRSR